MQSRSQDLLCVRTPTTCVQPGIVPSRSAAMLAMRALPLMLLIAIGMQAGEAQGWSLCIRSCPSFSLRYVGYYMRQYSTKACCELCPTGYKCPGDNKAYRCNPANGEYQPFWGLNFCYVSLRFDRKCPQGHAQRPTNNIFLHCSFLSR